MSSGSLYRSAGTFAAFRSPAWRRAAALTPEIAFLEQAGVSRRLLEAAAWSARDQGVGAEQALIAEGLIGEDFYYRALAGRLNCPFIDRPAALASGFDYRAALRASVARADPAMADFDWLLAPRERQIAGLLRLRNPGRIAICEPTFFRPWPAPKAVARCPRMRVSPCRAPMPASAPMRHMRVTAIMSRSP